MYLKKPLLQMESPGQKTLEDFINEFNNNIAQRDAANEKALSDYQLSKTAGLHSFYIGLALFGSLLLIVFLSIFIKIELNLRAIATNCKHGI